MDQPRTFTINIDGGSRGNPGPAAYAFVMEHDGEPVLEENGYIGHATNNVAEYTALIEALAKAAELKANRVNIRSDSELLVKQMRGEYRVKNPQLQELYQEADRLRKQFEVVGFAHVPREENTEADRLCNEALDDAARGKLKPQRPRLPKTAQHAATAPALPAADPWKLTLADAERMLRDAGHAWAESGMDSPTPRELLNRIVQLFEERGFVRRKAM